MTAEIQEPTDCAPRAYVPFQPAVKSSQPLDNVLLARRYLCKDISFSVDRQVYASCFNFFYSL